MNKIFNKKIILVIIFLLAIIISTAPPALAVESPLYASNTTESGRYQYYLNGWEVIPPECIDPNTTTVISGKTVYKRCDVDSFVQLFVNLAYIMLKLSPPLAIIIIIYGGFRFIGSRGKQESIQTGKKILSSAFLGLAIIIFLGWTLTFFVIQSLTGVKNGELFKTTANVTSANWWNPGKLTNEDNDPIQDLKCCVVPNKGCDLKSESDCNALGGNRSENQNSCQNVTYCLNLAAATKCCVVPDGPDPGTNPDACYPVPESDLKGCLNYSGSESNPNNCNVMQCDNSS